MGGAGPGVWRMENGAAWPSSILHPPSSIRRSPVYETAGHLLLQIGHMWLLAGMPAHQQERCICSVEHLIRNTAQRPAAHPAIAMGRHDDQIDLPPSGLA